MIRLYAALAGAGFLVLLLGALWFGQAREGARLARDLAACQAGRAKLEAAMAAQAVALAALKAEGVRRGRALDEALQDAGRDARTASARAGRIAAITPRGADVCARLMNVDEQIRRAR